MFEPFEGSAVVKAAVLWRDFSQPGGRLWCRRKQDKVLELWYLE